MKYELQRSFAAGELSELLYMRNDFENIYNSGVSKLRNMRPDSRGPAISREGMKHVSTLVGVDNARVVALELVDEFIVFVFSDLLLTIIRNIDQPIISTIVAPWTAAQVDQLQFASVPSDNVVYIVHPNVQPYKLVISATALQTEEFLSDGSFVVPAGITSVLVCVCGGGGGGAGQRRDEFAGAGGGGGAGVSKSTVVTIPAETLVISVGSGGTGITPSQDGANGGNSSIFGGFGIVIGLGGKLGELTTGGLGQTGGGNGGDPEIDGLACSAVCSGDATSGGSEGGTGAFPESIGGGGGGGGGGGFGDGAVGAVAFSSNLVTPVPPAPALATSGGGGGGGGG